ncbi:MAG: hypothetical protein D3924_13340, partial [Candidatus Electrothrix sp. AR4]|nr:hypothetical protein [Candidatus Electrothrix sp. AR4]
VWAEKVVVVPLGGSTYYIGASIFWTGAWKKNFQYVIGDGIQHEGSSYICLKDHSSSWTSIPPNEIYWSLMAAKGGLKGDTGPVGPQGIQGDIGSTGPVGPQGIQGNIGPSGPVGPQGIQGNTGPSGSVGPQGIQGNIGPSGPVGPQGIQGNTGPSGPVGPQGIQGNTGPSGTTSWIDGTNTVRTAKTVEVGSGVKCSQDMSTICDSTKIGTIRWSGTDFEGCVGTEWVKLNNETGAPAPPTVTSGTGKVWMDRNIGAAHVATAIVDTPAYGDLYQWGRGADGHQLRSGGITVALSGGDTPGHDNFITIVNSPWDWRTPQNPTLWQGASGINNPCPTGFRVPTKFEWQAEIDHYGTDYTALYNSPPKLPAAGYRDNQGNIIGEGTTGAYWSSSIQAPFYSWYMKFEPGSLSAVTNYYRADGFSIRCVKD